MQVWITALSLVAFPVILWYLAECASFSHRLEKRHTDAWAALGRPSAFGNGVRYQQPFLALIFGRTHLGSGQSELQPQLFRIRVLLAIGLTAMLMLFALTFSTGNQ